MAYTQTNKSNLGNAVLFICLHDPWRQNIYALGEVIYFYVTESKPGNSNYSTN